MYRALTATEIETLVDEGRAHETWRSHIHTYAQFAHDVYGPTAAIVTLGVGAIYNDEDYDHVVEGALVYNRAKTALVPDLSTLWWQQELRRLTDSNGLHHGVGDPMECATLSIKDYARTLPVPAGTVRTFFFDRPPHRTFEDVYVLAHEHPNTALSASPSLSHTSTGNEPTHRAMTEADLTGLIVAHEVYYRGYEEFAIRAYGPCATTIRIERTVTPEDEASLPSVTLTATVFDATHSILKPDFQRSWWRIRFAESPEAPAEAILEAHSYLLELPPERQHLYGTELPLPRNFSALYVLTSEYPNEQPRVREDAGIPSVELTPDGHWRVPPSYPFFIEGEPIYPVWEPVVADSLSDAAEDAEWDQEDIPF